MHRVHVLFFLPEILRIDCTNVCGPLEQNLSPLKRDGIKCFLCKVNFLLLSEPCVDVAKWAGRVGLIEFAGQTGHRSNGSFLNGSFLNGSIGLQVGSGRPVFFKKKKISITKISQ